MSYIEENEELYRAWIGQKKQDKYFEKIKIKTIRRCIQRLGGIVV